MIRITSVQSCEAAIARLPDCADPRGAHDRSQQLAREAVCFFRANRYLPFDGDGVVADVGPPEISSFWPALHAEFQSTVQTIVDWDERSHAERLPRDRQMLYVMERLVDRDNFPASGAAGLVGNRSRNPESSRPGPRAVLRAHLCARGTSPVRLRTSPPVT
jgi:hypothetical protein